jgi:hypothetical protein
MRHHAVEPVSWGRRLGIAVLCVAALALAGFAGALISGHLKNGSSASPTTSVSTTFAPRATTTTPIVKTGIQVVVANGTQAPNAAGHFTQVLQQQGWTVGKPLNATASATASTVYYATGRQAAAAAVAAAIGAPPTSVQPISSSTPVSNTTGDDIVVVIGPDLAGQGFPATTAG